MPQRDGQKDVKWYAVHCMLEQFADAR